MTLDENLRRGTEASKISTIALVFLAALKGIVGFNSGSTALIADAVHTSLDIFTSLAVYVGFKISLKHSGEQFPYGYYKAENLVALLVSLFIILTGVELVREALISLKDPVEVMFPGIAFGTVLFSIFALYALSQYKIRIGKQIDSQALIADAMHSYTDVFSSFVVVIAIGGSVLGIPWLDGIGVFIISLLIFKLGIGIARDSALTLMDAWLDKASIAHIRQSVASIQGVNMVKDIRLRKSGLVVFGEIAVEIEGEASLKRVEILSEQIKRAVKKEVKNLEHLVVNVKPAKIAVLKVALPVEKRNGLHSQLSKHFGKAQHYVFIELENSNINSWDIIENPAAKLERKRGIKTAEFLKNRNVNVLIVTGIGEGPFHALNDDFIKILQIPEGAKDVEEVVEMISDLNIITSPTE